MKFTDGYWMIREGVDPKHPTEAYDVLSSEQGFTVYATTRKTTARGATLNAPLLTLEYSSPAEDVIRVRFTNHRGGLNNQPAFALNTGSPQVQVYEDEQRVSLTSGKIKVEVPRGDVRWAVNFFGDGKPLTSSADRGLGSLDVAGEGHYMHEQLNLAVGETVYGLGERFTALVKNGQSVDIWNRDGGTGSDQAYKNIPFYLTNRGYGVFVNNPGAVSFEVASEKVSRVQFSVPGEELEYFVIYGPTPKEILDKYTALTGRPALPPAWSFGLWLTTSFTTNYDEATVNSFIQGMADRDIPLHVFHFDCFWMREFNWCDFEWDPRFFPDPAGMLKRLKERGLRISLWINSYIGQRSPLFDEAAKLGYLIKRTDSSVWQWDLWQAGMGVVDFTNPDACEWFKSKLRPLIEMGVDTFKTDFGERIPSEGVVYFDGSDPVRMHNYYTQLYNKVVFEVLEEYRGKGDVVLFARSATAGGQMYPVHWGGDNDSKFPSMAESLRGGLSLGMSGFGFWSHDIGGFEGLPNPDIYKRWIAFGLLSSHSRLHGSSSYRVPWLIDEESVDVLRHFTKLKATLMPYLYRAAIEAHERGTPVMRAMLLEFPNDPSSDYLDRQYMLGERLLVAPVFDASGDVSYYLPEGRWTKLLSGEVLQGGRWIRENHGVMSVPLLVRPNTVLAIGADDSRPDYDYSDGLTLAAYELDDQSEITVEIPTLLGEIAQRFVLSKNGKQITVSAPSDAKPWSLLLVNLHDIASLSGGEAQADARGLRIQATQAQVTIELA
jgi:alpha-D-xyloside xylohydrolase